ncbi:hypothetical protein TNIN_374261 [Trichonephila inaurata madagascariensis]|uniref:Uncharacterized protein n=1 Tax=Trichonephila inaurata madagascariensis TaxID=2747483 RepID=A0A8X6MF75_9ARAC|nr:hypothetical protein TNIN_374261 [Trichonephila inaurata madagascariensis]
MGKHKTRFYLNKASLRCPLTINIVYRRSRCPNEVSAHFIMRCPFTRVVKRPARPRQCASEWRGRVDAPPTAPRELLCGDRLGRK